MTHMEPLLGIGFTLRDRYVVQQAIEEKKLERIYLVEDETQGDEICILRQFISRTVGDAERTLALFEPALTKLSYLNHAQIQQIKDFFCQGDQLFIVQSYVAGKNYQDLLTSQNPVLLSEMESSQWLHNVLTVLSYLHSFDITHRDISPRNIILKTPENLPILTNFGIIRDIRKQMNIETTELGILEQLGQVSLGDTYTGVKEDLYGLAVTTVLLLTGKDISTLFNSQTQTWEWEKYKLVSDQLSELLNRMLAVEGGNSEAYHRFPSADAVLKAMQTLPTVIQFVPTPPIFITSSQAPTQIISPQLTSSSVIPTTTWTGELTAATPISTKNNNWLLALGIGVVFTLLGILVAFLSKGLLDPKPSATETPVTPTSIPSTPKTETPTPTVQPSVTPTPTPTFPPLTEQDTQVLVRQWQAAKPQIFAPPYDRQLVSKLVTGKLRYDVNKALDWLTQNNSYYRYTNQRVETTGRISVVGNRAKVDLRITEQYTLYKNGTIVPNESDFVNKIYRYTLEVEDGVWKIADYEKQE